MVPPMDKGSTKCETGAANMRFDGIAVVRGSITEQCLERRHLMLLMEEENNEAMPAAVAAIL